MSWFFFFVIFVIVVNLVDSTPNNRGQRPPTPSKPPKPAPKPVERIKPTTPRPTQKPTTVSPAQKKSAPPHRPVRWPTESPLTKSGVLKVTLTPGDGYLSNFEKNKRRVLQRGAINSSRFKLVHDQSNRYDSKAIKVLLDSVNIGFVGKQGTNGAVDRFCFSGTALKSNLNVNWDGNHLRIDSGNEKSVVVKTESPNPFQHFGVSSLWHMSHVDNISSILANGIASNDKAHSKFSPRDISNHDVQHHRKRNDPHYNRRLHEYAPTYISIKNPMLYVKKDMNFYLCILELSTDVVNENQFLLTDGNAAAKETRLFNKVSDLNQLPWSVLNADYWSDFDDGKRKKCAEVLIYPSIDKKYIKAVHCSNFTAKRMVEKNAPNSAVAVKVSPELFF